jgi:lysozyme
VSTARNIAAGAAGAAAIAAALIPFVGPMEGLRLDPYYDIGGVLSWCYGETAGKPPSDLTKEKCDLLLQRSLVKHAGPILECLPADAPYRVKLAFSSFGYNVGVKAACGSSAARAARAGDYAAACEGLMKWVYVKGVEIRGLKLRRQKERKLCLTGELA